MPNVIEGVGDEDVELEGEGERVTEDDALGERGGERVGDGVSVKDAVPEKLAEMEVD